MSNESEDYPPQLSCWITQDRICGVDCMAHLATPPETADTRGQPWARCHLLVNAHRAGKHLVVLASALSGTGAPVHLPNQVIPVPAPIGRPVTSSP